MYNCHHIADKYLSSVSFAISLNVWSLARGFRIYVSILTLFTYLWRGSFLLNFGVLQQVVGHLVKSNPHLFQLVYWVGLSSMIFVITPSLYLILSCPSFVLLTKFTFINRLIINVRRTIWDMKFRSGPQNIDFRYITWYTTPRFEEFWAAVHRAYYY